MGHSILDITDYKLEFMTQKLKNLNEIQHTEIFVLVKFWSGTLFFLTPFNLKLFIKIVQ